MKVYIGYDQIDHKAYTKCVNSLLNHTKTKITVRPLKHWLLRQENYFWRSYWTDERGQRWDDRDGKPFSTDFSFTRFCVPKLENYEDEWVLFCDPDMLWRADIAELISEIDPTKAVMCVKHDYHPPEGLKMGGLIQTRYERKNWSSLMLINPSRCTDLTPYAVNNQTGTWLHSMAWVPEEMIGAVPEAWNYLVGWSDPEKIPNPKIVHFTQGTPDMKGCEDQEYAAEWWAA